MSRPTAAEVSGLSLNALFTPVPALSKTITTTPEEKLTSVGGVVGDCAMWPPLCNDDVIISDASHRSRRMYY